MNIQAYKITILGERRVSKATMEAAIKEEFPSITSAIVESASPEFDMLCDGGSISSYPKECK